jgi:hypothetical protein
MSHFPSKEVYSLKDVDINLRNEKINITNIVINQLAQRTVSGIINAFHKAVIINNNGAMYINVSFLHTLLRTDSGAANRMWQDGINGYVSGSDGLDIDGSLYIAGPDFIGLVDARLQLSFGRNKLYLQYIQAIYFAISSHSRLIDIRTTFARSIEDMRTNLKKERIAQYSIQHCEFTGQAFSRSSQVEFAHINSVATNPEDALNINNGVIILKEIHRELTKLNIHTFLGMYEFCEREKLSLNWATR